MLHTLTLVVIPTLGSIPILRKTLVDEGFVVKHGTHVQPDGSEAAVGIACADFHDVSVVLDKASGLIKQTTYLLDARHRLYEYKPMHNTLLSLGMVYPHDEHSTISTGLNFFDFGAVRWPYLPMK